MVRIARAPLLVRNRPLARRRSCCSSPTTAVIVGVVPSPSSNVVHTPRMRLLVVAANVTTIIVTAVPVVVLVLSDAQEFRYRPPRPRPRLGPRSRSRPRSAPVAAVAAAAAAAARQILHHPPRAGPKVIVGGGGAARRGARRRAAPDLAPAAASSLGVVGPQEGGVVGVALSAGIAVVHQGVPAGLDRRHSPLRPGQRLFLLMRLSGGPAPGPAPGAGEGAPGPPPSAAAFGIVLPAIVGIAPPITAAAPAGRSAPPRAAAIAAAAAARHALLHGREELRAAVARPRPDVRRRGGAERIELRPQSRRRWIVAAALRGAGIGPGTCGHGGGLLVAGPAAGVGTRPVRGAGLRLLRPHYAGFPFRQILSDAQ